MKLDERLLELLKKDILTDEEYEEVESNDKILEIETLGCSGYQVGLTWLSATDINGEANYIALGI